VLMTEALSKGAADKLILLTKSTPLCKCGDSCETRKFLAGEIEKLINDNYVVEGSLDEDDEAPT